MIWTGPALQDAKRLRTFLAEKSDEAARRAMRSLRRDVSALADFPEMGRPVVDMAPEFRERVVEFGQGAYVVLYRYEHGVVVVLAVRHGREAGY